MSTIATIAKFRPVLSAAKILHIIKLCKADASKESLEIVADLARFEWQIQNDAITPAYIIKPKQSLSASLGFDLSTPVDSPKHADEAVDPTTLYQIWLSKPQDLTVKQIEAVRAWRYENNKMTMDEEKAFEKDVLGI